MKQIHSFAVALLAMFVLVILAAPPASAQTSIEEMAKTVKVSLETTTSDRVETSFDPRSPGVILYGQRWNPSERTLNISVLPVRRLTAVVSFDIGNSIDEGPKTFHPDTGLLETIQNLTGFVGESKRFELSMAYQLAPHFDVTGGYMNYKLSSQSEMFHPLSFDGSGYTTTYSEENRYRGFEVGVRSQFKIDKLGLEPGFLFYPSVGRHFKSHQFWLGEVFDNNRDLDEVSTKGFQVMGKITYDLAKHLACSFGYSYQALNSYRNDGNSTTDHLKIKRAVVGLQVGF